MLFFTTDSSCRACLRQQLKANIHLLANSKNISLFFQQSPSRLPVHMQQCHMSVILRKENDKHLLGHWFSHVMTPWQPWMPFQKPSKSPCKLLLCWGHVLLEATWCEAISLNCHSVYYNTQSDNLNLSCLFICTLTSQNPRGHQIALSWLFSGESRYANGARGVCIVCKGEQWWG